MVMKIQISIFLKKIYTSSALATRVEEVNLIDQITHTNFVEKWNTFLYLY